MVEHDTPQPGAEYRHDGTGDEVRFLNDKGSCYLFSVNGELLRVPTAAWTTYREYLTEP